MNYRLLLPLIMLCSAFPSHAQERWFEVELLLFQRNVEISDIKEDLASENSGVNTENSLSLFKTQSNNLCETGSPCLHSSNPVLIDSALFDTEANGFQPLDSSQLQLTAELEKLQRHALFTPVLHLAWRMPMVTKRDAIPLHIFAGKNFALDMPQSSSVNGAKNMGENKGEQAMVDNMLANSPALLTDRWAIDGNLKIYLDHYLFIDSQLLLRQAVTQEVAALETVQQKTLEIINSENDVQVIKPTDTEEPVHREQETVIKEILFDQNRRLRSEEIHYFDHPLMGMIVQIRKIDAAEEMNQ